MRVLETLSTSQGLPSIFRYRRDGRGIHIAEVGQDNRTFDIPNDSWMNVLATLDNLANRGALFSLEREIRNQSPYIQLYEELGHLNIILDGGNLRTPEAFERACIAAILFNEGYFVLHQGGLGVDRQTARIILRRSR